MCIYARVRVRACMCMFVSIFFSFIFLFFHSFAFAFCPLLHCRYTIIISFTSKYLYSQNFCWFSVIASSCPICEGYELVSCAYACVIAFVSFFSMLLLLLLPLLLWKVRKLSFCQFIRIDKDGRKKQEQNYEKYIYCGERGKNRKNHPKIPHVHCSIQFFTSNCHVWKLFVAHLSENWMK